MKKLLAVMLTVAMLTAMFVMPASAKAVNLGGGCKTTVTIKQTYPEYVVKDGVIDTVNEYEKVDLNLNLDEANGELSDLLLGWNGGTQEQAEQFMQTLELYMSWDSEHGINIALKCKPLETPNQVNDMPEDKGHDTNGDGVDDSFFPGDEFLFQLGMMINFKNPILDDEGNILLDRKGKPQYEELYYRGISRRTDNGEYLVGHYGKHGYCGSLADMVGGKDFVITYPEDGTVIYEVSVAATSILTPDQMTGTSPKDGEKLYFDLSTVAGGVGQMTDGCKTYAVSIGDGGYMSTWNTMSTPDLGKAVITNDYLTPNGPKTITYNDNGQESSDASFPGDYTLKDHEGEGVEGFTFEGWVTEPAYNVTDKPTVFAVDSTYTVSDNVTFYALYSIVKDDSTVLYTTKPEIGGHEHEFSTVRFDDTYHWHECLCGESANDKTLHTKGSLIEVIEPTEEAGGYSVYACGLEGCGGQLRADETDRLLKPSELFPDVKDDSWYSNALRYVIRTEIGGTAIMKGYDDGNFKPDNAMSRAEFVTLLWRIEGSEEVAYTDKFEDVAKGQWFEKAVLWAADKEIVNGVSPTKFDPNATVTREQIATLFKRYADYKSYDFGAEEADLTTFPDSEDVSGYAVSAIKWAVGCGIISGNKAADGRDMIDPNGRATRAQVAVMLQRFMDKI